MQITDYYHFTETYSERWELEEDARKYVGIETNDLCLQRGTYSHT